MSMPSPAQPTVRLRRDFNRIPYKGQADRLLHGHTLSQFKKHGPVMYVDRLGDKPGGDRSLVFKDGTRKVLSKGKVAQLVWQREKDTLGQKITRLENRRTLRAGDASQRVMRNVSTGQTIMVMPDRSGVPVAYTPLPPPTPGRLETGFKRSAVGQGLIKSGSRMEKRLMKTAGGRRVMKYARDPEVRQVTKDAAVLGGLWYAARKLPDAKKWAAKQMWKQGDNFTRDLLYEAMYPTKWQLFRNTLAARKKGLSNLWPGLKAAMKAARTIT